MKLRRSMKRVMAMMLGVAFTLGVWAGLAPDEAYAAEVVASITGYNGTNQQTVTVTANAGDTIKVEITNGYSAPFHVRDNGVENTTGAQEPGSYPYCNWPTGVISYSFTEVRTSGRIVLYMEDEHTEIVNSQLVTVHTQLANIIVNVIVRGQGGSGDCNHPSYSWQVLRGATPYEDGEEGYVCDTCGNVKERRPLSAAGAFDKALAEKIRKLPKNGTLEVNMFPFNTFGYYVREALGERPDVKVKASFLSKGYGGAPLKVTVPGGDKTVKRFDKEGFLGLCRAGTELGYDE